MDRTFLLDNLQALLAIPSPTGFTTKAMSWLKDEVMQMGYEITPTNKGSFMVRIKGKSGGPARFLAAHVDTLGAMVREIKSDGRLKIVPIGGLPLVAAEAANIEVHTRDGKTIQGTIMPIKSSVHLHRDEVNKTERTNDTVEIRLDQAVDNDEDVRQLGIQVGDYISLDPMTVVTDSGYIKSRFLDDKSCCAILLSVLKAFVDQQPQTDTIFMFSNYEEVGHGIYGLPDDIAEIVSVDIGVVGSTQTAKDDRVTIFAKDGATPYDFDLTTQLVDLCRKNEIIYNVDVIDAYASDASAAVRQGLDVRFACLGPGVESTHHYERTHVSALEQTYQLLIHYLNSPILK